MSGPAVFASPRDLIGQEGRQFGPTDWLPIEQDRIDGFADVTGDHQWIHVDTERAKQGPFGKTIAHGYLTLSLATYFRLRVLAPVPVGSRIRGVGELVKVEEVKGAVQSIVRVTIEIEGSDRPACVVDTISRYFPE